MRVVVSQYEGIEATPALPLAAGCLVSAAKVCPELADARFDIVVTRQALDRAVAELGAPDVLGLSLYPWNLTYSLAVAAEARRAHPGCLIVAGGPSVPRRPEAARRFLDEQAALDVLVFSEGELTFTHLLRAHRRGAGFAEVGGIAFRSPGVHQLTTPPARIDDFSTLPSPYLDGTFAELLERHRGAFTMAVFETNRGCPFSCTFCDWSLTKHVHEMPLERIHAEMRWVAERRFGFVLITDANFGIRPRDTAIARHLAELRRTTGSPGGCHFYLTKNNHRRNLETIEILQGAGIGCSIGLAVQDFDDGVLEAVKRDNIQTGESIKLRTILGDRGIATHNELILGLPGQTHDSFMTTIVSAMPTYPRHDFVVFLCRLIDNTEMAEPAQREKLGLQTRRCRWKTLTPGWDPIVDEYQEIVVGTNDLPPADWARSFGFVGLAGAAYNLRLFRVLLQYLVDEVGIDQRAYLADLCTRTADAAPGTVFAALGAIIDRYVTSIFDSQPFALPVDGGEHVAPVEIADALVHAVLRRPDDFFAELGAHTARFLDDHGQVAPALDEAVRFQRLITPTWGAPSTRDASFAHDWATYATLGGTGAALPAAAITLRFVPPPYVTVTDFASFATTHVGCVRARVDTGQLEPVTAAPRRLSLLSSLT